MRQDIMVDLETLGTDIDSTIIQISAVCFNIENGEVRSVFNECVDISKNASYELKITGDTIKWWLTNNHNTLEKILNEGEDSSTNVLRNFSNWLSAMGNPYSEVHLWGNGILFDNAMIKHHMETNVIKYPIHYRNDRDLRTVVDMTMDKTGMSMDNLKAHCKMKATDGGYVDKVGAHYALDDCMNQINLLVECRKILLGGNFEK